MAKEWFFNDTAGARRRVKKAYFYDNAGARRTVKAGYFYDSAGVRRQFYVGNPSPPAPGYYPGSNFTMQVGEDATYTGFLGGSWGAVYVDGGGDFPFFPTSDAAAHQAVGFYFRRAKSTSTFEAYWYFDPFTNPADSTKYIAVNVLNPNGTLYTGLGRNSAVETVTANSITHRWSYIVPLTVGSIYQFMWHEMAANTTVTSGVSGNYIGFSNGVAQAAFGSCANQMLTTRIGWNIAGFFWDEANEEGILQLQGPSGASDPGRAFLAQVISNSGVQALVAFMDGYSWNPTTRIAEWYWLDSGGLANGVTHTLQLG